mgnify:CR=1 FL=1
MSVTPTYTEINVIDNYAPAAKASVTVVNADGTPVDSACVEFKLTIMRNSIRWLPNIPLPAALAD